MQSQNNQTYDYIHPVKVKGEVLPPISDKIITGWVISFLIAAFAPPVNINGHIIYLFLLLLLLFSCDNLIYYHMYKPKHKHIIGWLQTTTSCIR
jgi:hypothetical protein